MIVYHGTTRRRAERICEVGFLPRKPSKRVWFARGKGYAEGRARTQARRAHDRSTVLTCELDLQGLRRRLGPKKVLSRGGIIAIDGPVPVDVLRSHPATDYPATPPELARWVNAILHLKPWKGVGRKHPAIQRLSRWVTNHMRTQRTHRFPEAHVIALAREWMPEYFQGVEIDLDTLHTYRRPKEVDVVCKPPEEGPDPREEEALALIESEKPRSRRRGLELLAELGDPDLPDWCDMCLGDESADVVIASLRTLRRCEHINLEPLAPLGNAADKRIRAAALGTLARHAGRDAPRWFDRGLKDPETCVRLETASALEELDPVQHRRLFLIALTDPNADVVRRARKVSKGKGFAKKGASFMDCC